ncbi:amidoligase family protein [Pararhodobacter sp. SW119]|uniref:amidoligase family protein n=1 Tax=Pararhodobacter sp. SW119 TaxID=2780075 RepID=UPI001ADFE682|nr:amidoligase family protein [Pararhodobacter sp. SW119]
MQSTDPPRSQDVTGRIERDRFWSLPRPSRADGRPRAIGIEIEFAGLSVEAAGALVAREWGGAVRSVDERTLLVEGTRFGEIRVELDIALGDPTAEKVVAGTLGELVPVEIVTPPLSPQDLPQAEALVDALRAAGARGTRDALAFGFGVHLNPEIAAESADFILPVVRAFALLEDWLRASEPVDLARRILPFIAPWPRALIDRIAAEGGQWGIDDLTATYLALSPTRNRSLDLLPLLEHLRQDQVIAALGKGKTKGGRPAFHYRLPEARIDEPEWTLAYEWNRWCVIERVAARPGLLEDLAEGWRDYRAALTSLRGDWPPMVEARLQEARIWDA